MVLFAHEFEPGLLLAISTPIGLRRRVNFT